MGAIFFDFDSSGNLTKDSTPKYAKYNKDTSAYSAGVMYFKNSNEIKELFKDVKNHINQYVVVEKNPMPVCMEQTFLIYNSFIQDKYDNQMMKKYVENNPTGVSDDKIVYHFPGGPGNYTSKYDKMNIFLMKMENGKQKEGVETTSIDTLIINYNWLNIKTVILCVFIFFVVIYAIFYFL